MSKITRICAVVIVAILLTGCATAQYYDRKIAQSMDRFERAVVTGSWMHAASKNGAIETQFGRLVYEVEHGVSVVQVRGQLSRAAAGGTLARYAYVLSIAQGSDTGVLAISSAWGNEGMPTSKLMSQIFSESDAAVLLVKPGAAANNRNLEFWETFGGRYVAAAALPRLQKAPETQKFSTARMIDESRNLLPAQYGSISAYAMYLVKLDDVARVALQKKDYNVMLSGGYKIVPSSREQALWLMSNSMPNMLSISTAYKKVTYGNTVGMLLATPALDITRKIATLLADQTERSAYDTYTRLTAMQARAEAQKHRTARLKTLLQQKKNYFVYDQNKKLAEMIRDAEQRRKYEAANIIQTCYPDTYSAQLLSNIKLANDNKFPDGLHARSSKYRYCVAILAQDGEDCAQVRERFYNYTDILDETEAHVCLQDLYGY